MDVSIDVLACLILVTLFYVQVLMFEYFTSVLVLQFFSTMFPVFYKPRIRPGVLLLMVKRPSVATETSIS